MHLCRTSRSCVTKLTRAGSHRLLNGSVALFRMGKRLPYDYRSWSTTSASLVHRGCSTGRDSACSGLSADPERPPRRQSGRRASQPNPPGRTWAGGCASTVRIGLRLRFARKVNVCVPSPFATSQKRSPVTVYTLYHILETLRSATSTVPAYTYTDYWPSHQKQFWSEALSPTDTASSWSSHSHARARFASRQLARVPRRLAPRRPPRRARGPAS